MGTLPRLPACGKCRMVRRWLGGQASTGAVSLCDQGRAAVLRDVRFWLKDYAVQLGEREKLWRDKKLDRVGFVLLIVGFALQLISDWV